jgi:transposase
MACASAWLVAPPPPSPGAISTAAAPASKTSTGTDVVVGVDTHKHSHMSVALSANGGWLGRLKLDAQHRDFQELIRWAAEFGSTPVSAVEATGCYGAGLCRALQAVGLDVVEVNRPDRTTRRRLGKDDSIDAVGEAFSEGVAAARSYIAAKATVIPKAGNDLVEMIRRLKVVWNSATENRIAALNQLHASVVTAPAALRERLQGSQGRSWWNAAAACGSWRPCGSGSRTWSSNGEC